MPRRRSVSAKLTPTAAIFTSTSPDAGAGSGASASCSTSGPPMDLTTMARMAGNLVVRYAGLQGREKTPFGFPLPAGSNPLLTREADLPVLSVTDAHKSYGATQALRGVTLELRERELLGLLGPNGAGKTTLVRALAGRLALDRGRIELLGQPLGAGSDRSALGVVPQEIALYPLLTARENLHA